jgi:hypothetical protein
LVATDSDKCESTKESEMPWYARYEGVDGSSRSDGAHLLYDLVVPTGQNSSRTDDGFGPIVVSDTHSTNSGDTSVFQLELTSKPTPPEPNLDSSAIATLINLEGSALHTPDGFFVI